MPQSRFQTTTRDEDIWRVLTLEGSVDVSTFAVFEEELTRPVEQGALFLKLELQGLKSINSTGLGLLMAAHRQLRQSGGRLVIEGMSAEITNIFNLLGFAGLVDEDEGEASVAVRR